MSGPLHSHDTHCDRLGVEGPILIGSSVLRVVSNYLELAFCRWFGPPSMDVLVKGTLLADHAKIDLTLLSPMGVGTRSGMLS